MTKLVRILLWAVGALLATGVALAAFLPFYFDPNDFKDEIAAAVKDKTGRDLTITGEMDLSVFPWLGMEIGEARLSNAAGFGEAPFAQFTSAQARLKLMPLLQGNIEVGRIQLSDLKLNLGRDEAGRSNWQDMQEHAAAQKPAAPDEAKPADDKTGKPSRFKVKSLVVAGLDVENASVLWHDRKANSRYQFDKLNLATGTLTPGKSTPIELSFDSVMGEAKNRSAKVKLTAEVDADPKGQRYRLQDFKLDSAVSGEGIPGGKQELALNGNVDADLEQQTAKIADLLIKVASGELRGNLSATNILDNLQYRGEVSSSTLNPRELMGALGKAPPETTDSSVLKKLQFDAKLAGTGKGLDLDPITLVLDDTNAKGSFGIADFASGAMQFTLQGDKLDADRYLPPPEKAKKTSSGGGASAGGGETTEIPVDTVKDLNLDGRLSLSELKLKGLKMTNVQVLLSAHNGRLEIQPLQSSLYGGNLQVKSSMNASGATPSYALDAKLNALQFLPFLKDLAGKDFLAGLAQLTLDLTSSGRTTDAVMQSLNGSVGLEFKDGSINGVNLGQMLRTAYTRYKGESLSSNEPEKTDFSLLAFSGLIRNGVLSNNDLDGKSPLFRVGGKGALDLARERIDYTALVSVVGSLAGQGGADLSELKGISIPVKISGSLFAPEYKIDFAGLLQGKLKETLEAEKDKLKQELEVKRKEQEDKLKGELFDRLGGKKQTPAAAAPATGAGSEAAPTTAPPAERRSTKDLFKDQMREQLGGKPKPAPAPAQ
ncbi:MAG: AsmA family protein [Nevskiales bacterium]